MTSEPNVAVSILHNVTLNERGNPTKGMLDGWEPTDTLECVFTFTLDTDKDHEDLLDMIFAEFNVGKGILATAYRAKNLRSLSRGDIVIINGVSYACDRFGWTQVNVRESPPTVDTITHDPNCIDCMRIEAHS